MEALRRYGILDTPAEELFDDIATLASQLCQAPIALISLVDGDWQWFKSVVGLEVRETDRDISFCSIAIQQPQEPLIVGDAMGDLRFRDNPLVQEAPHIRFYAGFPLVTSDGYALGTVCVIDRVARTLEESQIKARRTLSRQVMQQLEFRRITEELTREAAERRLWRKNRWKRSAENGLLATELHAIKRFDVILMDVQMPEMDSLQATTIIRKREAGTGLATPNRPKMALISHPSPLISPLCLTPRHSYVCIKQAFESGKPSPLPWRGRSARPFVVGCLSWIHFCHA